MPSMSSELNLYVKLNDIGQVTESTAEPWLEFHEDSGPDIRNMKLQHPQRKDH